MELGIKGNETRSYEVIDLLKMLGGINRNKVIGGDDKYFYYICDKYKDISNSYIGPDETEGYIIFTLEDFLEKFPYKVGDKVNVWVNADYYGRTELETSEIKSMRWNSARCEVAYRMKELTGEFYKSDIKCKVDDEKNLFHTTNEYEEIVEKSFQGGYEKCKLDIQLNGYELSEGYHFVDENGNVIGAKKIKLVKNAPSYPKTYDECLDVLSMDYATHYNLRYFTYEHGYHEYATTDKLCSLQDKLNIIGKLIICRNAYWKITGDELGLNKPWEPDWTNETQHKYSLYNEFKYSIINPSQFVFPTEEMRDMFYKNFKYLIDLCKELL